MDNPMALNMVFGSIISVLLTIVAFFIKQLHSDFKRMEKAEVLNAVKVSVVNEELTAKFTTELKDVQFKLDELSDKINNVNARSTISFELSEEVATKIGL